MIKKRDKQFSDEDFQAYMALSAKQKLKHLEEMNIFFS